MEVKILVINGPNLNLLGTREPDIYGNIPFEEYVDQLRKMYPNILLTCFQSNVEGEIINKIQEVGFTYSGIVLNAGGYTHTSVAIRDAIQLISAPVVEVHISNIYAREEFRRHSMLSSVCLGVVAGFGLQSYDLAIKALLLKNN